MVALVPCLTKLRSEFNTIAPRRDKASDGWIADEAHEDTVSDHNNDETGRVPIQDADDLEEVHAIDVDIDFREPGLSMEEVIQFILARCRNGKETRLRYIIYNKRIWRASNGWRLETYTGSNPHDKHAHYSSSYETAKEASTASWHLENLVALTNDDLAKIKVAVNEVIDENLLRTKQPDDTPTSRVGRDGWDQGIPNAFNGGKRDMAWEVMQDLGEHVKAVEDKVDNLLSRPLLDAEEVANAILVVLTPEVVAAIPQELADAVIDRLSARTAPQS